MILALVLGITLGVLSDSTTSLILAIVAVCAAYSVDQWRASR